jgi:hypothetical protein
MDEFDLREDFEEHVKKTEEKVISLFYGAVLIVLGIFVSYLIDSKFGQASFYGAHLYLLIKFTRLICNEKIVVCRKKLIVRYSLFETMLIFAHQSAVI